jgi:hypothetical protein
VFRGRVSSTPGDLRGFRLPGPITGQPPTITVADV